MRRFSVLLIGILVVHFSAWGAGLLVGAGNSIQLGVPDVETNYNYDFVTVQSGGSIEVFGDVRLHVTGDVQIDGDIFSTPTATQTEGEPGDNGEVGLDDQPTGLNAGTAGALGGMGESWEISASYLTIRSGGSVTVNGTITLRPKLDGGKGGHGGTGGSGGSGASVDPGHSYAAHGGGAGQGGEGGFGGRPGNPGNLFIAADDQIVVNQNGLLSLDNLGRGGDGGDGGDGGNGGHGGNAIKAGDGGIGGMGGFPGSGGTGWRGGGAGIMTLRAPYIALHGIVSLTGGPGGDGGPAGVPGNGGDGGNAGPDANPGRGGNGGNAGSYYEAGFSGGAGGDGGPGGHLYLDTLVWTNDGTIDLSGGIGGTGGPGWEEAAGGGGQPGSPNGIAGADSVEIPVGTDGGNGPAGQLSLRDPWGFAPGSRLYTGFLDVPQDQIHHVTPGVDDSGAPALGLSAESGPFTLTTFVNTYGTRPLELSLRYRWLTKVGSFDVTLAGMNVLHLDAPTVLASKFSDARVLITDPALLDHGFQVLALQLNPGSPVQIEISDVSLVTAPDRLYVSRSASDSSMIDLSWFGVTNYAYQLQERTFAPGDAWSDVGAMVTGQDEKIMQSRAMNPSPSAEFFRLSIMPPP